MSSASKVVLNTGVVYLRLLISLFAGFFTTRLVLDALGSEAYGVYILVAGVVTMLSFLQSSMSLASSRFIAHSIGSKNMELIKSTFSTILRIHLFLGILIVFFLEAVGILMFKYWLEVPTELFDEAKIVYHMMAVSSFIAIISVPYDAVIKSHENFTAISILQIFGTFCHLSIAIYLTYKGSNLLVTYGFLLMTYQLLQRILMQIYSRKKYIECRTKLSSHWNKNLFKEILIFSSWNLLATTGSIIITQSRNILLNIYFGVRLNAANGISQTLTGQLNGFSTSMTQAINPQIIKSEGGGDRKRMLMLTGAAAKFSLYLFFVFSIPVFLETEYLLKLWLIDVPDYVAIFTKITIVTMLIEKFTFPIISAINATGKNKQISIAGLITLALTIPFAYGVFEFGAPPYAIYLIGLFISLLSAVVRLYYGKMIVGLNIRDFVMNNIIKTSLPLALSFCVTLIPYVFIDESFLRLIIITIITLFSSIIFIRLLGLNDYELNQFRTLFQKAKAIILK
jgi:O-antigen/teichoic acid export membrane protein